MAKINNDSSDFQLKNGNIRNEATSDDRNNDETESSEVS